MFVPPVRAKRLQCKTAFSLCAFVLNMSLSEMSTFLSANLRQKVERTKTSSYSKGDHTVCKQPNFVTWKTFEEKQENKSYV